MAIEFKGTEQQVVELLLTIIAVGTILFAVLYLRLRLQLERRIRTSVEAWKHNELERERAVLRELVESDARLSMECWRREQESSVRADAIRRSSAVVTGQISEHLAPWLGSFRYNPKDVRFLGTPIDLVIFDGMREDALREIVFLEIKTGSSTLNTRQRRVRDAVEAKRVRWEVLELPQMALRQDQ